MFASFSSQSTSPTTGIDVNTGVASWDANLNIPFLASGIGVRRSYYTVVASGVTNLDGISSWLAGDHAVFNGKTWERWAGNSVTSGGQSFVYVQNIASSVWTIAHNFYSYPEITIVDSSGNLVEADILYVNLNVATATFSSAMAGTATAR